MKLAFALAAALSLLGCGTDTAAPGTGPGSDSDGTAPPTGDPSDPITPGTGPVTEVSGEIAASTTWTGTIHVTGGVTIDRAATVTVAPGTVVDIGEGITIIVQGTLAVQGTKAGKVTFQPSAAGEFWGDISIPSGGVYTASYLVMTGGSFAITNSGKATLIDSQMSHAGGDLMTMSGGTLDMTYSAIGVAQGQRDTTHCDMHVSGAAKIRASHSNLSTSAYGVMYYGGIGADFTYNNWFGNSTDIDTLPAYPVSGDFSHGFFASGAPSLSGVMISELAPGHVDDAGVR